MNLCYMGIVSFFGHESILKSRSMSKPRFSLFDVFLPPSSCCNRNITDDMGSNRATYQLHNYSQTLGKHPIRVRVRVSVRVRVGIRVQLQMEKPHELRIIIN